MNKKIEFLQTLKNKLESLRTEEPKTKVNYNGQEYYLEDLYQLTKDGEKHICVLESGGFDYIPSWGVGMTGDINYDYHLSINPKVYTDIATGEMITYRGYEKQTNCELKTISQEEFDRLTNTTSASRK